MLEELKNALSGSTGKGISFELITHCFTKRAKNIIPERFPHIKLLMDEDECRPKSGPYGYLKYVRKENIMHEIEDFFYERINRLFPEARIDYFT